MLAELQAAHDHPTAAELYERLRPRLPRLSLGTVSPPRRRAIDVRRCSDNVHQAPAGAVTRRTQQGE
ncbi:MAG: hypothetical protein IPG61_20265 [bacterium]|nr:hypothetical protein [bacterium]